MPQATWTDPFLDSMRQVGDPPADVVVAELFAGGATVVQAVNYLMRDLVENDDLPSRALPQHVRDYFQAGLLPAWADPARLAAGAELFQRFGPLAILLLNAYSLPLWQSIDAACDAASRAGAGVAADQAVGTSAGTGIARRSTSASRPRITR